MRHLIADFDAGPKSASRRSPLISLKPVSGSSASSTELRDRALDFECHLAADVRQASEMEGEYWADH
jgi:hypothetical protein